MTHDDQSPSGEPAEQTHTAEGNVSESAPVAAELHDHDVTDHGEHDHDAHDQGAHGEDASEKSTLVPVTWRQLIFPALILLIVIILLIGPVSGAFAPKPAPAGRAQPVPTAQPTATPAPSPAAAKPQNITVGTQRTATTVASTVASYPPTLAPKPAQPTAVVDKPDVLSESAIATRTAVAVLGENGQVARAPVQMQFEGALFTVDAGSGILPDWKPSGDVTHATWIEGTYANNIIYLPYSDSNAALFGQVKTGDMVKLTMNSGQVFDFQVTRSQRALNGPPTADGQFTVTTAMNQDHAGVTVFLIGDPAPDRAVVQADFNGNIE
jgi:hypothetical protein